VKPKTIRKKRPEIHVNPPLLTDAEIEQQFGERLSPAIKSEYNDEIQQDVNSQVVIQIESVPQTPIEKARAKLTNALGRKIIS